jgi:5-methyltetrahydropteroyltriglutamate--homocysteine methyltransferase
VLKVTLPSPSLFANFWDPEGAPAAYRSVEDFLADVAELLREEADELEAMGATYLQLDAPHYTMVLDPRYRNFYTGRGWPTEPWIELGLELDNRVIGDRQGVTALGGFRAVAAGAHRRWVVLGLVTTKRSGLESVDDLARRIEAASRYVPLDRLGVSPQCGFATSVLGNALTIDAERAKLALVAAVARKVWG